MITFSNQTWTVGCGYGGQMQWVPVQWRAVSGGYRQYVCPDLLSYDDIGAADGARGRAVRAFFRVMRLWPVRRG